MFIGGCVDIPYKSSTYHARSWSDDMTRYCYDWSYTAGNQLNLSTTLAYIKFSKIYRTSNIWQTWSQIVFWINRTWVWQAVVNLIAIMATYCTYLVGLVMFKSLIYTSCYGQTSSSVLCLRLGVLCLCTYTQTYFHFCHLQFISCRLPQHLLGNSISHSTKWDFFILGILYIVHHSTREEKAWRTACDLRVLNLDLIQKAGICRESSCAKSNRASQKFGILHTVYARIFNLALKEGIRRESSCANSNHISRKSGVLYARILIIDFIQK